MSPYEHIESAAKSATSIDDAAQVLNILLFGGFSVHDDSLYSIRQLVAWVDGLKIEIFAREHPPPHFHVSAGNIDATFSLADCSLINGRISGRERSLVEWWYKRSRPLLVETWNQTRPTDCPVGPIT
jgi:Domain of unknown function (DUF4160)